MKKILFVAALGVIAVLAAPAAFAVCGNNLTFGQTLQNCGGGYCYVTAPGGPPSSGSFWGLGTGNPVIGLGDDNGTQPVSTWCRPGTVNPGCYLVGGWNSLGLENVDGCLEGKVPAGKTTEVMVAAFSAEAGGQGYYAVASSGRNNGGAEFEFTLSNQNITLVPIAPPTIANTVRSAPNVTITVNAPSLSAGGFSSDGTTTFGEVVTGYRVYKQVLPRGETPLPSRTRTAWVAAGAATASGAQFSYTEADCATNKDIYLTTAVVFNSGFESDTVSANSRNVQCGPTIAEPKDPQFRVIDRKTTKNPITPR